MTTQSLVRFGCIASSLFLFAGCGGQQKIADTEPAAPVSVSCIAVMPAIPAADYDDPATEQSRAILLEGSRVLNGLLKQQLAGKKVHFVDEQGVDLGSPTLEKARALAQQYQCNAVLDLSVSRYVERVGGDYGVKQPAAVTFAYRLYETGEGRVLCHGRFDERQQSLMENLLTLPKAQSRGLTWLTAEELARDGLREQFGECSYIGTPSTGSR
ncbi:MAG: hypothetical protein PHI97_05400 [Desulfobulbus sp.]|nr:hypothetical protein [Desulfobulbus sp.]